MGRGAQKATKAQQIKALLLQGWQDDMILKTVGCSASYLHLVKGDFQHELANGHHRQAG
jgi:hypothetical protein